MIKNIAILFASLVLMFAPMNAANAHAYNIYQGADFAHIGETHSTARIHDMECDSRSAYMETGSRTGFTVITYDTNGCTAGGTQVGVGTGNDIRVCERIPNDPDACTAWKEIF